MSVFMFFSLTGRLKRTFSAETRRYQVFLTVALTQSRMIGDVRSWSEVSGNGHPGVSLDLVFQRPFLKIQAPGFLMQVRVRWHFWPKRPRAEVSNVSRAERDRFCGIDGSLALSPQLAD